MSKKFLEEIILDYKTGDHKASELPSQRGFSEGIIKMLLNKENRIMIGKPYHENLVSSLLSEQRKLPSRIERLTAQGYDFYQIALSCSYVPNPDCIFLWAQFDVELFAKDEDGNAASDPPLIFDMSPQVVSTQMNIKNDEETRLSVNFKSRFLNTVYDKRYTEEKNYSFSNSQLTAYGINTSRGGWIFEASSKQHEIKGNYSDLLLIIQVQKNCRIYGKFNVASKVAIRGYSGFIPLTKRKGKLVSLEHLLT